MPSLDVVSIREGRRFYRRIVASVFGGVCPVCGAAIEAHLDTDVSACLRRCAYWDAATFARIVEAARNETPAREAEVAA